MTQLIYNIYDILNNLLKKGRYIKYAFYANVVVNGCWNTRKYLFENMYNSDDRILRPSKLQVVRNLFGATHRENSVVNYDRFIPCRASNNWQTDFATIPDSTRGTQVGKKARENGETSRDTTAYNCLLKNELLGETIEDVKSQCDERQAFTPVKNKNLFKYGTPTRVSLVYILY